MGRAENFPLQFGPVPAPTKVDGKTITGTLSAPSVGYSSKEQYP